MIVVAEKEVLCFVGLRLCGKVDFFIIVDHVRSISKRIAGTAKRVTVELPAPRPRTTNRYDLVVALVAAAYQGRQAPHWLRFFFFFFFFFFLLADALAPAIAFPVPGSYLLKG